MVDKPERQYSHERAGVFYNVIYKKIDLWKYCDLGFFSSLYSNL